MMTFLQKTGRCVYWLAVAALSISVWWLVNDWLGPKPVWTVPMDDTLQLTHYQPSEKLLAGYRVKSADQIELVVFDPATGLEKARLTAPTYAVYKDGTSQPIDIGPRLYDDTVVRFTSRYLETGEFEVQFRSWKYAVDSNESILASWRFPSDHLGNQMGIHREWMKSVWSTHDAGLVLVYQLIPIDELCNGLLSGFNIDLNLGYVESFRQYSLSVWKCEAWQWNQATKQFNKVNQYSVSNNERAIPDSVATRPSCIPHQNPWTPDGRYYSVVAYGSRNQPVISRIDPLTGAGFPQPLLLGKGSQNYDLHTAGDLQFHRRGAIVDRLDSGKVVHLVISSPHKGLEPLWSINQWRPLWDAKMFKKVEWPSTLDHTIVGADRFTVDAADASRFLYHTNIGYESPYYLQREPDGYMNNHFIIMRYREGELKIEHQWLANGREQWWTSALCGQLFVEGQVRLELPEFLATRLAKIPALWCYYEKNAKINAPYVAEVALEDGTMRWKKLERELAPIPFLGKDHLLLRYRTAYMANMAGYECWKLPIKVSSPWWGLLSGLGVFIVLVPWSLFTSLKRPSPKA